MATVAVNVLIRIFSSPLFQMVLYLIIGGKKTKEKDDGCLKGDVLKGSEFSSLRNRVLDDCIHGDSEIVL